VARSIRRHPEAEAELLAAAEWYDDEAGLGADFLAEVRAFSARITDAPESFPPDPEIEEVRRARVRRFPYSLVFTVHDEEVFILAVAHVRREPGYWLACEPSAPSRPCRTTSCSLTTRPPTGPAASRACSTASLA
jgi:plasmid stabilization system protein ParE